MDERDLQSTLSFLVAIAVAVGFGYLARCVSTSKGRGDWFWWGFFFGFLPIFVASILKSKIVHEKPKIENMKCNNCSEPLKPDDTVCPSCNLINWQV